MTRGRESLRGRFARAAGHAPAEAGRSRIAGRRGFAGGIVGRADLCRPIWLPRTRPSRSDARPWPRWLTRSGQSAGAARGGQSAVALSLWHGLGRHAQRFWLQRRSPFAPRAARLAGQRVARAAMVAQTTAPQRSCSAAPTSNRARANEAAQTTDRGNRLLWRMNRRRLEGEAVRDAVLAVSGKLNRQQGGPAVRGFCLHREVRAGLSIHRGRPAGIVAADGLSFHGAQRAESLAGSARLSESVDPDAGAQSHDDGTASSGAAEQSVRAPAIGAILPSACGPRPPTICRGQVRLAYRLAFARQPSERGSGRSGRVSSAGTIWPSFVICCLTPASLSMSIRNLPERSTTRSGEMHPRRSLRVVAARLAVAAAAADWAASRWPRCLPAGWPAGGRRAAAHQSAGPARAAFRPAGQACHRAVLCRRRQPGRHLRLQAGTDQTGRHAVRHDRQAGILRLQAGQLRAKLLAVSPAWPKRPLDQRPVSAPGRRASTTWPLSIRCNRKAPCTRRPCS